MDDYYFYFFNVKNNHERDRGRQRPKKSAASLFWSAAHLTERPHGSDELGAVLRGQIDDGMAKFETESTLASHGPQILDTNYGADGGTNKFQIFDLAQWCPEIVPEFRAMDPLRGDLDANSSVSVLVETHTGAILTTKSEFLRFRHSPLIQNGEVRALIIGEIKLHVQSSGFAIDITIGRGAEGGEHRLVRSTELQVRAWLGISEDGGRFLTSCRGRELTDGPFAEVDLAKQREFHGVFSLQVLLGEMLDAVESTRLGSVESRKSCHPNDHCADLLHLPGGTAQIPTQWGIESTRQRVGDSWQDGGTVRIASPSWDDDCSEVERCSYWKFRRCR